MAEPPRLSRADRLAAAAGAGRRRPARTTPALEQSVRQSIQVILSTRPGEQLMRPDFGAGLERFLHEPNTLTTRRRIRDVVRGVARAVGARASSLETRRGLGGRPTGPTRSASRSPTGCERTGAAHQLGLTLEPEASRCPFGRPPSTTAASTTSSTSCSRASPRTRRSGPTRAWAIPGAR